jgi:DNA polymerase elongation subunit (family B)
MAIAPPLRRLFFDIETSPNVGFFWRPGHRISLSHENIIHERQIITVAWKWQGQKTVHHLAWDKDQNDKTLVTRFLKQMERADEIVAHFGDGFDIPWMRARALINGFRTLPFTRQSIPVHGQPGYSSSTAINSITWHRSQGSEGSYRPITGYGWTLSLVKDLQHWPG